MAAVKTEQDGNGNYVGLVSSYKTTDGQSHEMADVWFAQKEAAAPDLLATTAADLLGSKRHGRRAEQQHGDPCDAANCSSAEDNCCVSRRR